MPIEYTPADIARFWSKVDKSGDCWLWTNSVNRYGYGYFTVQRVNTYGHRVSYELHFGAIPPGMCICHHCDNPRCVRPDHLFLGTRADNSADMKAKGRATGAHKPRQGSGHGRAKLTESQVVEIRRLVSAGTPQRYVAMQFGISQTVVWHIHARRTWRHVP